MKTVYVIGSLRNDSIPQIGNALRTAGFDAFDDWHGAGPHADDEWKRYERARGRNFREAIKGFAAQQIFNFDRQHLNRAHAVLLVMPAGKSGHLEFGYAIGQGKPGVILFPPGEDPDAEEFRWDVMTGFASALAFSVNEAVNELTRALESK